MQPLSALEEATAQVAGEVGGREGGSQDGDNRSLEYGQEIASFPGLCHLDTRSGDTWCN